MQRLDKVIYTARTHTSGDRTQGVSRSDDGRLEVTFARPGAPGEGTNPEQLFAAGWSACFLNAMKIVAGRLKIILPPEVVVDAEIDVGPVGEAYGIAARLNVGLPGLDPEVAHRLLEATHLVCPYSRATAGNIEVAVNLAA
ncbi:MAG TPA: organic hydroperoxide resistance protein [Terriglobales bacterium]|nr:organic hydroperoxide resistance protein [Terriglobales bacterium]